MLFWQRPILNKQRFLSLYWKYKTGLKALVHLTQNDQFICKIMRGSQSVNHGVEVWKHVWEEYWLSWARHCVKRQNTYLRRMFLSHNDLVRSSLSFSLSLRACVWMRVYVHGCISLPCACGSPYSASVRASVYACERAWAHVCVYMCMCVCVCVCVLRVRACVCACTCVCVCMCVCARARAHPHLCVCVLFACARACVYDRQTSRDTDKQDQKKKKTKKKKKKRKKKDRNRFQTQLANTHKTSPPVGSLSPHTQSWRPDNKTTRKHKQLHRKRGTKDG